MPSLQTALPPEMANNVIRLYRECLRRAKFVGHKRSLELITVQEEVAMLDPEQTRENHNTELVVGMVRQQFKRNMKETDPEKIQKMKDEAARGLINHMLFESEKMSSRKFSL